MNKEIKRLQKLQRDTAAAASVGLMEIIGAWLTEEETPQVRKGFEDYVMATLLAYHEMSAGLRTLKPLRPSRN